MKKTSTLLSFILIVLLAVSCKTNDDSLTPDALTLANDQDFQNFLVSTSQVESVIKHKSANLASYKEAEISQKKIKDLLSREITPLIAEKIVLELGFKTIEEFATITTQIETQQNLLQQKYPRIFNGTNSNFKIIEEAIQITRNNNLTAELLPDRAADCLRVQTAEINAASSGLNTHLFACAGAAGSAAAAGSIFGPAGTALFGVGVGFSCVVMSYDVYYNSVNLANAHYTLCMNGNN